jgi:cytochrome b pre-mRNA-processing protein 3
MSRYEKHNLNLYNILITLSRNIFFYNKIGLKDSFETRVYLIFFHFSIMMIVSKKKGKKFDQFMYDSLFHNIENNLRELGFGDVTVNKKMKDLNKILYDILLKIELKNDKDLNNFKINSNCILNYFNELKDQKGQRYTQFQLYLSKFYNFCFELHPENMVREAINFKN